MTVTVLLEIVSRTDLGTLHGICIHCICPLGKWYAECHIIYLIIVVSAVEVLYIVDMQFVILYSCPSSYKEGTACETHSSRNTTAIQTTFQNETFSEKFKRPSFFYSVQPVFHIMSVYFYFQVKWLGLFCSVVCS